MTDPKPCPNPECVSAVIDPRHEITDYGWSVVVCPECNTQGPLKRFEEDAIEAWNALPRHTDTEADEALKREVRDTVMRLKCAPSSIETRRNLVKKMNAAGWPIEPGVSAANTETNKETG